MLKGDHEEGMKKRAKPQASPFHVIISMVIVSELVEDLRAGGEIGAAVGKPCPEISVGPKSSNNLGGQDTTLDTTC